MLRLRPLGLEEIPVPVFSPVVFLLFFSADFSPALQVYKLLQMQAMDYLQVEAVPSAPGAPVHHRRHSHTGVRGSREFDRLLLDSYWGSHDTDDSIFFGFKISQ
jgi:hypothetical protein